MEMKHVKSFPWSFSLFIGLIYALLNGLGLWQIERHHEKTLLLNQIAENREAPIIDLEHLISTTVAQSNITASAPSTKKFSVLETCLYRRVSVEGKYLHQYEMHLYPRTYETSPGVYSSGFHVITPFQLESGAVILINRGWAPLAAADLNTPASKSFYRPKTSTRLIATVYPFPRKSYFSPQNDVPKNRWFRIDTDEIAKVTGLMTLMPVYAIAEPYTPGGDDQWMPGKYDWPVVVGRPRYISNKHLEYALTWYLLSFVVVIMFLYAQQKWYRKYQSIMMGFKGIKLS